MACQNLKPRVSFPVLPCTLACAVVNSLFLRYCCFHGVGPHLRAARALPRGAPLVHTVEAHIDIHRYVAALEPQIELDRGSRSGQCRDTTFWRVSLCRAASFSPIRASPPPAAG